MIGFDLLHRFYQPDLLKEIYRVATPSAPLIFPHVHLTNNFPEPFFERGCRQLHGNDYAAMFQELESFSGREGYILSEPWAFRNNDAAAIEKKELVSTPAHADYNGCIAWLDPNTKPYLLPWRGHTFNWETYYLLQNPFLSVNFTHHQIEWNRSLYGDQIDELLQRHRVYYDRITPSVGTHAPAQWSEILYWAKEGKTLAEIMQLTGIGQNDMQQFLDKCWHLDLAQALPVDEAGFRLQVLLGRQDYILERNEQQLHNFWKQAVKQNQDQLWIKTANEMLSYNQGDELIQLTQNALVSEGINTGDRLLLCTAMHYETLIIFWAAAGMGITVVPISVKESEESIQLYLQRFNPTIAFVDPGVYRIFSSCPGIKIIMTDRQEHPDFKQEYSFESLLSRHMESPLALFEQPDRDDIAVILSTTGSTGNPKSVPLTHGQLIRSGRLMTETYQWGKKDNYFALGGLETMSGLRNATVCIAEAGAVCIVAETGKTIYEHMLQIQQERVTILSRQPPVF